MQFRKLGVLFCSFGIIFSANAQTNGKFSFGIDLGRAQFHLETSNLRNDGSIISGETFNQKAISNAFSLLIAYRLNDTFAIEGSYTDFGAMRYSEYQPYFKCVAKAEICNLMDGPLPYVAHGNQHSRAWGLSAKAQVPLGQKVHLYGKLGANAVTLNTAYSYTMSIATCTLDPVLINGMQNLICDSINLPYGTPKNTRQTEFGALIGAGLNYRITPELSANLEISQTRGFLQDSQIRTATLGLRYDF